jgi:GT2 family glycosyltransferase
MVVDSCPSTNQTAELVKRFPLVRYVRELHAGAGIARNRALTEAAGGIVAFTDDDAEVSDGWLEALLNNFSDPMVGVVTGITLSRDLETRAQIWFEQEYGFERGYTRREFDLNTVDPLVAGLLGASVNVAIRKSILPHTGIFDPALGPGTSCLSGEDHEFFYRVLSRGYRGVYDPAAVVWHRHRPDWEGVRRAIYGYGVGVFAWWLRALVFEGEWGVLRCAPGYFLQHHLRNLLRSFARRPGSFPIDLSLAEFSGALAGPGLYLRAHDRTNCLYPSFSIDRLND